MPALANVKLTIEKNALVSLLLSLVLVVLLGWMVNRTLVRISQNFEQIVRANSIMDNVLMMEVRMVDVETGERGYIVTGNAAYLGPHEDGLRSVGRYRDEIVRLLGDDSFAGLDLKEFTKRLDAKFAVSRANVDARKRSFEEARLRVVEGSGKREMDALRLMLSEMMRIQSAHRDELRIQRVAMIDDLKRHMLLAIALVIFVLVYLHVRLLRMMRLNREAATSMEHLASHDVLTGLPNRRLMLELIGLAVQRCMRHKKNFALLFLDLNGFKPVNDQHGHEAGDEVLRQVAARLSALLRTSDSVARLGGDEFLVMIEEIADEGDVEGVIDKIRSEIARPMKLKAAKEVSISASIGVAIYPADGSDVDALLHHADLAMYKAKSGNQTTRQ